MLNELSSIRDWLRYAVSRFEDSDVFFGHGTSNAYDEAVWIIFGFLRLPHDTIENFLDAHLTSKEKKDLLFLIEKRIKDRIPTAYLLNEAWLRDYKFYVDERVIIPRSLIAESLSENLYPWVNDPEEIYSALDLCTGSGCLGIMMAHSFQNATIDLVDLSEKALQVAEINVNHYGLHDRIELIQSDLFNALNEKKYDLIISNPPYVNQTSVDSFPLEFLKEPSMALGSGEDGLDHTIRIIQEAKRYLNDGGMLIVEIGHNKDVLLKKFPEIQFQWLDVSLGNDFVFMLEKSQLPD
ncbi:MAG TPA: 50S ribosomal protein L3 N(5)-glutamine methyltransferase [Methylophilaceae bacterium]|nr:50S ribosomal protein L3 N(5)-glutamine methyltransferase [Methylophilaceae bacterium]HAP05088.1 50S ribosomal protein L3 N(5)-glutamine methyltransferase [Methylophilaceae bacterium]HCB68170.1 50S ribosomal protein L3 N(5)-glutamine methyltransferase [Methylophilaceae bacterium]